MSEDENIIYCNEKDMLSLQCGEYLSRHHNGKKLVISDDIRQGQVKTYNDLGFEEFIELD